MAERPAQDNHLGDRVKSTRWLTAQGEGPGRQRGRPKTYGKKIKLKSLLADVKSMQQVASPVTGDNVTLVSCDHHGGDVVHGVCRDPFINSAARIAANLKTIGPLGLPSPSWTS